MSKHPRGDIAIELAWTAAVFVVGFLVGIIGPGSMQFESGVIAAAKGTYVATRVDLPDGTTEWHVTRARTQEPTP